MLKALISMWLWYTIDDRLAELFEKPEMGELGWGFVFIVFWIMAVVVNNSITFSAKHTQEKNEKTI